MFGKGRLLRDGARARALVLEKKVYAAGVETGAADACRYTLRVRFDDGSTTEITRRVLGSKLSAASVGELVPVRYDPGDPSKIEIDGDAIAAEQEAASERLTAETIARGERELEGSADGAAQAAPDAAGADGLLIGDADRELVESALSDQLAAGRLTIGELEARLAALLQARTRAQVRAVLSGLPLPAAPGWLSGPPEAAPRPPQSVGAAPGGGPSDEELAAAERAWRERSAKTKAARAAHKEAEGGGDKRATLLAFNTLQTAKANEKSARAKLDRMRRLRPDWTSGSA